MTLWISCNESPVERSAIKTNITPKKTKTEYEIILDSLRHLKFDSTIEGKAKRKVNQFQVKNFPWSICSDSLFDLNYDQNNDLVISYYGMCGTGLKNRIEVYLWDKSKSNFVYNTLLSSLSNPGFYLDRKKITTFYIAYGGGSGGELQWNGNEWKPVFLFEIGGVTDSNLVLEYPKSNCIIRKKKAYFYIPPDAILENPYNDDAR
jgi:hypothetical protein